MRIRAALTAAMMALGLMSAVPAPADAAMGIKGDPKVAFIYIAPVGDLGWTWAHDQSRKAVEKELGVQTAYTESIPEVTERVSQVIDRYVGRGFNIIVGTAFGYSDAFKEAAARHPEDRGGPARRRQVRRRLDEHAHLAERVGEPPLIRGAQSIGRRVTSKSLISVLPFCCLELRSALSIMPLRTYTA